MTDSVWPWRRLVAIGVGVTLVAGGLHFYEVQHLRGASALLDDLSTVRSAVYRAVAVAETTPGSVSAPMDAVDDLQRVAPRMARLRAATVPEQDRRDIAALVDSVASLERQLKRGGLTDAEVQAALDQPDAISMRVDGSLRAALGKRRRDLDASYALVLLVAVALFALAVASSRRTELRRTVADRLLAEREERYRLTVESLQEGVLIYDAEGRIQAANSAAERVLGITIDELKRIEGDHWAVFDENGTRLALEDFPVRRVLRTGLPERDVSMRVVRPGQEPVWLTVTALALRAWSNGDQRGAVVTFVDVTTARATRLALAESESTSAVLMNALQDGVFVAQDGVFAMVNPSLADMLGYDRAELEGQRFEDVVDPVQLGSWNDLLAAQATGDAPIRPLDVRLRGRHDEPPVDFELVCSPVTFRGRPAALGLLRDISVRQAARAELLLYRSHLEEIVRARTEELETALVQRTEADTLTRLIADNIPGRLAYWDRALRCRFVNRVYAQSLGHGAAAFVGRGVEDIFGPAAAATILPRMQAALDGQAQRFELDEPVVDDPVGASRRTLYQYVPDSRESGVEGFFVLALDVTEGRDSRLALQRLNDELVIERDRSAAASTAKSAFLANMSHEIRTPMNAIIGLTHLMRRENPGGTLGERLGRVAVAAQHLLRLLDDILDLSKIDAGKLVLDDTEFRFDALLSGARDMVTDAARSKGVMLVIDPDHVPRRLRGDPMRLSQALVNLLGNAVKFIEHGSVTLAAHLIAQCGDAIRVRIEVHDTGPGVAPDKLATLFDAFEQADSSTTRRFGGTGLGLAITNQLAQLMGGSAGARSEVGVGSTFWIEVALRTSGAPVPESSLAHGGANSGDADSGEVSRDHRVGPDHPEPTALPLPDLTAETALRQSHAGARILLAEDSRINQEVAVTLLQQAGLVVDVAHDGLQAVALAHERAYALILMDMQMPMLDGPAAAERIRAVPQTVHTPIVAMTASAYVEDRDRCMAAGMNDFIAKPVDPPRLYATIAHWLGAELHLQPSVPLQPQVGGRALEHIEGLDAARGRAFFAGDDTIYRRALEQFCAMYGRGIDPASAGAGEITGDVRLQRDLHSFSGAASAVGALDLSDRARQLEKHLRTDDRPTALPTLDDFNARLTSFTTAVEAALRI